MNSATKIYCGFVFGCVTGMFHMAYQMSFNGSHNVDWAGPAILAFALVGALLGLVFAAVTET